jgi:hypothetical protein
MADQDREARYREKSVRELKKIASPDGGYSRVAARAGKPSWTGEKGTSGT